jgi:hypothetical protein
MTLAIICNNHNYPFQVAGLTTFGTLKTLYISGLSGQSLIDANISSLSELEAHNCVDKELSTRLNQETPFPKQLEDSLFYLESQSVRPSPKTELCIHRFCNTWV